MKEFTTYWMQRCNPSLILRYWRHKQCPGQCTVVFYGVTITFIRTLFGEIAYKNSPFNS